MKTTKYLKIFMLLIVCGMMAVCTSCKKDDDTSSENGGGSNPIESGYAPQSVNSKKFVFHPNGYNNADSFRFGSGSSMTVFVLTPDVYVVSTPPTPNYSYSKTDENTAKLYVNYETKWTGNLANLYPDWRGKHSMTFILTFIDEINGTYSVSGVGSGSPTGTFILE